jgi:glycosyltransferase involved in cell wall biosynthesis
VELAIYTDADERGGAESALGGFIERYRPDIRVTVLGPDEAVVRWLASRRPGSRYAVLPPARERRDVPAMLATRRAVRRLRPDVIHFNLSDMSSCQWPLAAVETIPGLPVVVMEHSPVGTRSALSNRLKKVTSARAAAHVSVGDRAARIIEGLGDLPAGSIRVIHSGVPKMELDPPARTTDDFTIGMLARHDPAKGVDRAIRIVDRLGPGFRLVVIGDGRDRAELEALVEALGVGDRVELRGWDDRGRHLLPTFDVYLLPSRLEAFPVSIQEAMQAGVPVVATDVGSVREAVDDGDTGVVVPASDDDEVVVAAMVEAIRELAADRDRLAAMGERARVVGLERFDTDAAVRQWEALYDEVIRAR